MKNIIAVFGFFTVSRNSLVDVSYSIPSLYSIKGEK